MSHSQSGSSSSSSSDDDDYEIIGVRQPLRRTPPARRAHAINVHERLELRQLTVEADDYLSICHLLNMLSILTLTLIAQLRSSASLTVLVKTYRGIIAFLAVCKNELDVLTELEMDIRAPCPEHRKPLCTCPIQNRTMESPYPSFAHDYTRFTKDDLQKL